MDKNNVLYTHKGIPFSLYKEGNTAICNNMYEPGEYYTKESKPTEENKYSMVSLICGTLKRVKLTEIEYRMVLASTGV